MQHLLRGRCARLQRATPVFHPLLGHTDSFPERLVGLRAVGTTARAQTRRWRRLIVYTAAALAATAGADGVSAFHAATARTSGAAALTLDATRVANCAFAE